MTIALFRVDGGGHVKKNQKSSDLSFYSPGTFEPALERRS